jgi:hypothetical protein
MNQPAAEDGGEYVDDWASVRDVPIYLSNLAHRRDRFQHSVRLLRDTLGFRNVSRLYSIPKLSSDRLTALVQSGLSPCSIKRLSGHGASNVGSALANALSHFNLLVQYAEQEEIHQRGGGAEGGGGTGGSAGGVADRWKGAGGADASRNDVWGEGLVGKGVVGVFEDDLMLADSPSEVKRRIRDALDQLPASADMLYLEASWDTCKNHAFNPHRPALVRAVRPSGSAAIFFTRKGRLKVRQMLASQPWHWIDLMYAAAINAGALEAYMTMPPCFMQDGFFGTEYSRASEMPAIAVATGQAHQPVYPVCVEHYFDRPTPFNTLSFSMAHMHTRRERLIGKGGGGEGGGGGGRILSRTLAILSKDLQKVFPREHNMYATWVCLLSSPFVSFSSESRHARA